MSTTTRRIAIVGAGPAGLTAAHRLQAQGAAVVVFEARGHVGGRTHTDEVEGWRVDGGAQLFASGFTGVFALLKELGAGDRLVRTPGRDALWRGGRAHEVVYGSVASMATSGGLPLRTKLRLGASYVPFLARHGGSLDLHAPERASYAGLDGETIQRWGERELGREFVEYLAYPQLASYYGSLPEETSAGFYHILAQQGMQVTLYALRGGIGTLCELLAARVRARGGEVRTGVAVRGVVGEGRGVRVLADEGEEDYDGVVVAVPGSAAGSLLLDAAPPLAHWLAEVRTRPALTLALLLDRPLGVRYFGLSLPREAGSPLSAVCVEESKGAGLVPEGRGLLVAFAAPRTVPGLMQATSQQVVDELLPALTRLYRGVDGRVLRARVYRWPEGNPIFYPGYLGRLAAFRGGGVEGDAPLALAGDYLMSPTVEGAVGAGAAAAERLWARLEARSPI